MCSNKYPSVLPCATGGQFISGDSSSKASASAVDTNVVRMLPEGFVSVWIANKDAVVLFKGSSFFSRPLMKLMYSSEGKVLTITV
jgi:hypothetical protein